MRESDFDHFSALLDDVLGMYPRSAPITPRQRAMFFRAVAGYTVEQVQAAFDAHVKDAQRGRFAPLPADVIAQLEGAAAEDGRPGAEEAWAIAVRAADESTTVVWTDEMAQAWGIAHPVLAAGDKVGARMAFKEAYERLVDDARSVRCGVAWSPSLGHDTAGRDAAIAEAVERGQLRQADYPLLPAPAVSSLVQLLEGPAAAAPSVPAEWRERLAQQREELLQRGRLEAEPRAFAAAPPVTFRAIPADCLPPGMRPRPETEVEYAAQGVAL